MKSILPTLVAAGLVAGHGYVDNGTIGGVSYEFYQPYTDVSSDCFLSSNILGMGHSALRNTNLTLHSRTLRPPQSVSHALFRAMGPSQTSQWLISSAVVTMSMELWVPAQQLSMPQRRPVRT